MSLIDSLFISKDRHKAVNKSQSISGNLKWSLDQATPATFLQYQPNFGRKFNSEALAELYNTVGAVNAVINYIANKVGEIPVQHVRYLANGKKKVLGETDALKALQVPSALKTQNTYIAECAANLLIHGNVPIWMLRVPGFEYASRLEHLAPQNVFAIPRLHSDQYGTPQLSADPRFNELIGYKLFTNGIFRDMKPEEVIYIKMLNPNRTGKDWYYGMSPLYGAIRNIDILSGLYDTINTITQYRGALGFISKIKRANDPDPVITEEEKERAEQKLLDYGVHKGQRPIFLTHYDLKWNRIDNPISEFLPVELDEKQFGHLCNQFSISDVLFNSKLNSTYNNVKEAHISAYQNCMMPLLSNILAAHSQAFGITKDNEWFEGDWSGVAALQEDEKQKFEALEAKRKYFIGLWESGLITRNGILSGLDMPEQPGEEFNTYRHEQDTQPPANAGAEGGTNQAEGQGNKG